MEAALEKWEELQEWFNRAVAYRGAWRIHVSSYLLSTASGFGTPLTYAALLSSLPGDPAAVLQEGTRVFVSTAAVTSGVCAVCTLFWSAAADLVSRKKMLLATFVLRALQFLAMGMHLLGAPGSLGVGFWYLASVAEGMNPSQAVNVEYTVWLDMSEGDDAMRSDSLMLSKFLTMQATALGTGFGIGMLHMQVLPLKLRFSTFYFILSGLCVAGLAVAASLRLPHPAGKPGISGRLLLRTLRDTLGMCRTPYTFWALARHSLVSATSFRALVTLPFCMAHYGWSQDEYMMAMALPTIGTAVAPWAWPMSQTFGARGFIIYLQVLNFLLYDVFSLLYPLGYEAFLAQLIMFTPVEAFLGSLQDIAAAGAPYNSSELRGRSAYLFAAVGRLVSALTSPTFAGTFAASATTYKDQVAPFLVVFGLSVGAKIIHLCFLLPTDVIYLNGLAAQPVQDAAAPNADEARTAAVAAKAKKAD